MTHGMTEDDTGDVTGDDTMDVTGDDMGCHRMTQGMTQYETHREGQGMRRDVMKEGRTHWMTRDVRGDDTQGDKGDVTG